MHFRIKATLKKFQLIQTKVITTQIFLIIIIFWNIENYLECTDFSVDTISGLVKHLDCITVNDETYYYENLLNIEFLPPTLDDWGNVLDSALTQQEIILDNEIYYFTKDNLQYLIPRFVFNSELDTITLQPNNSLKINSSIMFRLLSTGLLE